MFWFVAQPLLYIFKLSCLENETFLKYTFLGEEFVYKKVMI